MELAGTEDFIQISSVILSAAKELPEVCVRHFSESLKKFLGRHILCSFYFHIHQD